MPFAVECLLPEKNSRGRFRKNNKNCFIYNKQLSTETVTNLEYLFARGIDLNSHLADWFDICFPKKRTRMTHPKAATMDTFTAWTNTKAVIYNVGK